MKKVIFTGIFVLAIFLTACVTSDKKSLSPDNYEAGNDMQYFQTSEGAKGSPIQETEWGCYILRDEFVYAFNCEANKIRPLCSKANCLHDQELEPEKKGECNAYVGEIESSKCLMLYDNTLYAFCNMHQQEGIEARLFRFAADGSSRDILFQMPDATIDIPLIHRGKLFFHCVQFSESDGMISSEASIQCMDITKRKLNSELVFEYASDKGSDSGFGFMKAYGNYLYFDGSYTDKDGVRQDPLYFYSINEKTVTILNHARSRCAFLRGKIYYFPPYNEMESAVYREKIYCADLDGSNQEVFLSGIPQSYYISSDQNYLYFCNAHIVRFGEYLDLGELSYADILREGRKIWAYHSDGELADEFRVPDTDVSYLDPPIGGTDYQYEIFDDPDTGEWGLLVWDKSKIGSYNGAAFEQQRIIYGAK